MNKIDDNLVVYTVIEPIDENNDSYKLSALLCLDGSYTMPSLELLYNGELWDSVPYLKRILNVLRNWNNRALTEEDVAFLKEINSNIPGEDFEELLLMFEKADKLGFFNEN